MKYMYILYMYYMYMYIHSLLYEVHVYIAQMSQRRNKVMVMLRWGYDVKRTARVEVKILCGFSTTYNMHDAECRD